MSANQEEGQVEVNTLFTRLPGGRVGGREGIASAIRKRGGFATAMIGRIIAKN